MPRKNMADASDVFDAVLLDSALEVIPLPKKPVAIGLSILIFSVIFFGYIALEFSDDSSSSSVKVEVNTSTDWRHYSVVAPIDTGINVYHDHFRTDEVYPNWLLEQLGVTMTCGITLEGTWQERYEADRETCWDTITTTDIVYFYGTKKSMYERSSKPTLFWADI